MSSAEHSTIFDAAAAVSSAVKSLPRIAAKSGSARTLSPAAIEVADQEFKPAYSPIVLAGTVRLIEAALVIAVGLAVYFWHVVPAVGFAWYYVGAIVGIAIMAMLAFQVADIYQVQAFRGHEKQYMRLASAWSVVFLIAISLSFFAKAGDQFSRAWLGAFYVLGLLTLIAFRRALFLLVRRWTRQGRVDRRTVVVGVDLNGQVVAMPPLALPPGRALDAAGPARPPHRRGRRRPERPDAAQVACRAARFRRPRHRRVRRSRRRPQPRRLRRRSQSRHGRRYRRVRAKNPRRSRDLFAADRRRRPHPAHAQEAVGAAARHPPLGAQQQAALPAALLFLYRHRARARRLRPADCRLGHRDEMAARQDRRIAGADLPGAGHAAGCARHQARQQGADLLQATPPRLQQRVHRSLQVPLALCRAHRPDRGQAGQQERPACHPDRPLHPQD